MEKNFTIFENIKSNISKTKHNICTTLTNNLTETNTIVVENKAFIGFTENDENQIKNLSSNNNNSLNVKNNINVLKSICCNDKIYIGYTDFSNLNNDTNLHVKGDTEINGNLYVYDDIVVNKNLYTCCNLNVGFNDNKDIKNDYILNVNGQSYFNDNLYLTKSILIEENIIVDKESYLNSIYLNTNITLDKEIFENINFENINNENINILTINDKLLIINNIIKSLYNYPNLKGIIFNNGDNTFNNGIASVSKKIIINNKKYYTFILINFISHSKIKTIIKPIIDTFTMFDAEYNEINNSDIINTQNDPVNLKHAIIKFVKNNNNTTNNSINTTKNTTNTKNKIINTKNIKNKFNFGFMSNLKFISKFKNFNYKNIINKFNSKNSSNSDDSDDYEEQK